MPDGYSYDEHALRDIKSELDVACSRMDTAVQESVRAPDAGESSDVVGDGIAELIRMGTAMTHVLDNTAQKVHAASGAYADIENMAKNRLRVVKEYGRGPGRHLPLDGSEPDVDPESAGDDPPVYAQPSMPDLSSVAPGASSDESE